MPTPSNSGNPASPAPQPATAPSSQEGTPAAGGTSTPTATNPPVPQTFSGTWFQQEDPQTLIQWTLKPAQDPSPSSPPDPGSGSPSYTAQVRIYQLIFDTAFPNPPLRGFVVPFSVTDPSVGTAPYLQGSFMLSQTTPPSLQVLNLRFPGFPSQNLTLYPDSSTDPGSSGAPETSPSATSQSPAAEAADESPAA